MGEVQRRQKMNNSAPKRNPKEDTVEAVRKLSPENVHIIDVVQNAIDRGIIKITLTNTEDE